MIETNEVTAGPPPRVDAQDPLPEASWFWRRIFVFLVTTATLLMAWQFGDRLADVAAMSVANKFPQEAEVAIEALLSFCHWLLAGTYLTILFYMVAPSAEQLTKMIQTARSLRGGVAFRTEQIATSADGASASATSQAGQAPLHPGPSTALTEASGAAGLPDNPPGAYEGPDLAEAPAPAPDTPEDAQWPK